MTNIAPVTLTSVGQAVVSSSDDFFASDESLTMLHLAGNSHASFEEGLGKLPKTWSLIAEIESIQV